MTLINVGHFANQLFDYCLSQQEKYLCRVVQWLRAVGGGGGGGGEERKGGSGMTLIPLLLAPVVCVQWITQAECKTGSSSDIWYSGNV